MEESAVEWVEIQRDSRAEGHGPNPSLQSLVVGYVRQPHPVLDRGYRRRRKNRQNHGQGPERRHRIWKSAQTRKMESKMLSRSRSRVVVFEVHRYLRT